MLHKLGLWETLTALEQEEYVSLQYDPGYPPGFREERLHTLEDIARERSLKNDVE